MPPKLTFYRELKNIGYELFIGALSILTILNFGLSLFFTDHQDLQTVLTILSAVVTPIFMADFLYRFFTARSRSRYFWRGFGWADLLSSLPFPQLKIMRIFRLIRVIRLLVEFGARRLFAEFISKRAQNALLRSPSSCFASWSSVRWRFFPPSRARPMPTSPMRRTRSGGCS